MSEEGDIPLEVLGWDPEAERLKNEAEVGLIKSMRIGDRVAVTFTSKLDLTRGLTECDPFTLLGSIVALELHKGRGYVTIAFEGQDVPVGPFSPLELRLIATP